jgi:hypothetical protein
LQLTYCVRQLQRSDRPDATPRPAKIYDDGTPVTYRCVRH